MEESKERLIVCIRHDLNISMTLSLSAWCSSAVCPDQSVRKRPYLFIGTVMKMTEIY